MSVVGAQVRAILRRVSDRKRFKDGRGRYMPGLQNAIDIYGSRVFGRVVGRAAMFVWVVRCGYKSHRHTRLGDEGGGGFANISDVLDVPEESDKVLCL